MSGGAIVRSPAKGGGENSSVERLNAAGRDEISYAERPNAAGGGGAIYAGRPRAAIGGDNRGDTSGGGGGNGPDLRGANYINSNSNNHSSGGMAATTFEGRSQSMGRALVPGPNSLESLSSMFLVR